MYLRQQRNDKIVDWNSKFDDALSAVTDELAQPGVELVALGNGGQEHVVIPSFVRLNELCAGPQQLNYLRQRLASCHFCTNNTQLQTGLREQSTVA